MDITSKPRNTTSPILAHGSRHISKKKYCFWESKFHNIPEGALEHFVPADRPSKPQSQHRKDNQNIWTSFSCISSILRPQTNQKILLVSNSKSVPQLRGIKQNEHTQSVDGTFKIAITCTLTIHNTCSIGSKTHLAVPLLLSSTTRSGLFLWGRLSICHVHSKS